MGRCIAKFIGEKIVRGLLAWVPRHAAATGSNADADSGSGGMDLK